MAPVADQGGCKEFGQAKPPAPPKLARACAAVVGQAVSPAHTFGAPSHYFSVLRNYEAIVDPAAPVVISRYVANAGSQPARRDYGSLRRHRARRAGAASRPRR